MKDHAYQDRQRFLNRSKPLPARLQCKVNAAIAWLGERWVLARPVGRLPAQPPEELPAFLKKQARSTFPTKTPERRLPS
ncbi:MAG: hypothetical protein AB1830_12985 [Pseudomonadota bacterium]